MCASKYALSNLTFVLDYNRYQLSGAVDRVMPLEPLEQKWQSFGFGVQRIDGHDIEQIIDALLEANEQKNQPTMIVLNTVKGKGISFMENNIDFHGVPPNEIEYKLAMKELETQQKELEATL